jgi:REP element-mobilizing transposase RayT
MFTSDKDIAACAHWLEEGAAQFEIRVHAWVFMTNHVHLNLKIPGKHSYPSFKIIGSA